MSGGLAYVLDRQDRFEIHCNKGLVDLERVVEDEDIEQLNSLIKEHYLRTRSSVAKKVLDEWDATLPKFIKVFPRDYRRVLEERKRKMEEQMIEEVA